MKNKKFNSFLKFALSHQAQKSPNHQGFVIPVILGFGLFMLLVAIMMITRSGDDKVTAILQKQTAESLGITETGFSRSIETLSTGNNGAFLKKNYDPINPNTDKPYLGPSSTDEWTGGTTIQTTVSNGGCDGSSSGTITVPLPTNLLNGTTDNGQYTLLAYRYDDVNDKGTFILQGNAILRDAEGNEETVATSRIQTTIDIVDREKILPQSFPGLFMEDIIKLGNNDMNATSADPSSIICAECEISDPDTDCVDGVPTEDAIHEEAMGANPGAELVNVTPKLGRPNLPSVPTPSGNEIALGRPGCPGGDADITALPRAGDTPNTTGTLNDIPAYEYTVECLKINGTNNLTVTTTDYPVHIYLIGDGASMTIGGQGSLFHVGDFGEFAIFGKQDDGTDDTNQTISLNGGGNSQFFVFAPDAEVGISGGAFDPCDMGGVVWAEVWDGSSGTGVDYCIPEGAAAALGAAFGLDFERVGLTTRTFQHSSIIEWTRKEAN